VLRNTKNNWRTHNAPTVLPVSLTSDDKVKVEKEDLELAAKQKWEVHHISPSAGTQASNKVIVYFHGGAFIRPVSNNLVI
jgi:acetyl esterase/lipase